MLDITLLENILILLEEFKKENFIVSDLKLKVIPKDLKGKYFLNYNSLEQFKETYNDKFSVIGPKKYCIVGDFPFPENIKIENKNVDYDYSFHLFNLTSGNPIIKDSTEYLGTKNNFILSDKEKYKTFVKKRLLELIQKSVGLANIRLGSYVDACYVKPDYVQDEFILIENSIENKIKK